MKRRSSISTDDGSEPSLEPEKSDSDLEFKSQLPTPNPKPSPARSRRPNSLNWKHTNGSNGHVRDDSLVTTSLTQATMAPPPSADPKMALVRTPTSPRPRRRSRSASFPILSMLTAACGIALLFAILRSLVTRQLDPKGCRMSYMRPSYVHFSEFDTEHTRFATKYSLYLYREQGLEDEHKLHGIPVLFIPGNAGSYKQVRPIASETANYFHHYLQHDGVSLDAGVRNLDFFTVDFNEDITAFHGQTLLDQAEYLNEAVRYILSLYTDPQRVSRDSKLPDPTSVIILGHSMGGVVARTMLIQPNYQAHSVNTILTMSAPHARPPVTFDGQIVQIYDEINDYWRKAYSQKWANNNPLWHVTLVSIAGGGLDTVVPSDYASLESLVPSTHGFTVFSTGIPTVWSSMDHQAILWCDQFRKVVAKTLYDIVDVHRASQTKPRADRMRVFQKRLLTGMEPKTEKSIHLKEPGTLLTFDEGSSSIISLGERLVLQNLGLESQPKVHLLTVPPLGSPEAKRFGLLTDAQLGEGDEGYKLDVLFCSVHPFQAGQANSLYPIHLDFSKDKSVATRLACTNAAPDVITLPASTSSSLHPFVLEKDHGPRPFSYLEYDLGHLVDYQFVAVIDKTSSKTRNFVIAEFSEESSYRVKRDIGLARLLTFGTSIKIPANRPMTMQVNIPSIQSALLAYDLEITSPRCHNPELFAPLVRQYLDQPNESKYFVNARQASISLHGVAPYLPPSLKSTPHQGLSFDVWTDPSCESSIELNLKIDAWGSLGKLYMRYRTVFAAFPLLIVTLVLRKQFRVYDTTGIFISFSESLDLYLRQSIPLLLLSLTLLSMSLGGASVSGWHFKWSRRNMIWSSTVDFHQHDLLIGTEDPFFWFLVPLIGVVCIGVCTVLHYMALGLTHLLSLLLALFSIRPFSYGSEDRGRARSPAFVPSTPRRRIITTAILLFLVSTFIPYQFAYLVACIVQLFTVVRALRIKGGISSTANSNYYHYAHSVFLLMLWVLPINLPILAVWVRNLTVHWLTPFSSHHNVLSIMPFILLVENLTTGKMIPQLTSGLRHVTSVLLFVTALFAAVYGISHAYMLHYLVNVIAAWLVLIHSTADTWSLSGLGAMFDANSYEARKRGKSP